MLLRIDYEAPEPIYLQIRNQIVTMIASGDLQPGEKLPTVRALSAQIGINPMTVNKAYAVLKSEGYIKAGRRSGASVSGERNEKRDGQKRNLRLAVAEMKAAGAGLDEILGLCKEYYENGGGDNRAL